MHDRVRTPRGILLFAAVALGAEWLGHAGTWWLTGGVGPGHALSGSVHAYLGPIGVVLALVAVATAVVVLQALRALAARAERLRAAVGSAWRVPTGGSPDAAPVSDRFSTGARPGRPGRAGRAGRRVGGLAEVGRLAGALLGVQLTVYLIQENLEVRAAGLGWPGLHVLSAHHGSAVAVHAAVALVAAWSAVAVLGRWVDRRATVARIAALYRALVAPRGRRGLPAGLGTAPAPVRLWPLGDALWPRPPPRFASY